jgi:hypothetical protein
VSSYYYYYYYYYYSVLACYRLYAVGKHVNKGIELNCIIINSSLPVVLYGWETWSLTLREEHRLRVFENRQMGEMKNAYRMLVGSPEDNRSLGRSRRRWVDNIKIYLKEIGCDGMVWTGSIWFRIGTSGGLL